MVNKKVRALIAKGNLSIAKLYTVAPGRWKHRRSGSKNRSLANIGVIPMIAPYVSRFPYLSGYLDRNACRNLNSLPPILSAIVTDYNNRRVLSGFCLHLRLRAAHLTGKEDHR